MIKPTRFTRFEGTAAGEPHLPDADKKFTRFRGQEAPVPSASTQPLVSVAQRTPAPQPAPAAPVVAPSAINLADHLDSDEQISISVLHRALPQRFAEMRQQGRTSAPS